MPKIDVINSLVKSNNKNERIKQEIQFDNLNDHPNNTSEFDQMINNEAICNMDIPLTN